MQVISDTNIFATLVEAIKLRVPHERCVVEMDGEGGASIAVGKRMLIKVRDFGRRIDCYRHPLHQHDRRGDEGLGREVVREAHELVRNALADTAINMFKIVVG